MNEERLKKVKLAYVRREVVQNGEFIAVAVDSLNRL